MTPRAEVKLKDPCAWVYIGNEKLRRLDSVAKTTGAQQFPIDVQLPGMLTAVIAHPPLFGAKAKSFDAAAARQVKGVVEVVETPRGVAVVARDTWSAIKGREALRVDWDEIGAETRSSADLMAQYKELARSGKVATARNEGDTHGRFAGAAKVLEAEFEFPYLAHAAMEPLDAVARFENGTLEIWAGHQMPDLYQAVGAQIMGIEPAQVKLHVMTPGGFFGRRAVPDADVIVEVVSVLKATGAKAPVKVLWTREDDTQGGRYRPMYYHTMKAGLDAEGNLVAWQHRIVGQSILAGTPFESMVVKDGVDPTSVEGASNLPYAIPNILVDLVTTDVGVPVLWWRSVGSTHTAYSTEVFIDELAQAAGKDPVEFRRSAAARPPAPPGRPQPRRREGRLGQAAAGRAIPRRRRARIVRHLCRAGGRDLAPRRRRHQGRAGGLRRRLRHRRQPGHHQGSDGRRHRLRPGRDPEGRDHARRGPGRAGQLRHLPDADDRRDAGVEVHIVPSTESPTGVGEPGVPPIGPAVANAVYAATGKRIQVLPFSRHDFRTA